MTFKKTSQTKTTRKARSELGNQMSMTIRVALIGSKIASLKKI